MGEAACRLPCAPPRAPHPAGSKLPAPAPEGSPERDGTLLLSRCLRSRHWWQGAVASLLFFLVWTLPGSLHAVLDGHVRSPLALATGDSRPEAAVRLNEGFGPDGSSKVGVQALGVELLRSEGHPPGGIIVTLGSDRSTQEPELLKVNPWATAAKPKPERCNVTAPVLPAMPLRSWRLGVTWRRACEAKQRHDGWYPFERNWCWVGFKAECHAQLKSHRSWTTIQEAAAQEGNTPPVSRAPFYPIKFPEVCDRPHFGEGPKWTQEDWSTSYHWFKKNVAMYVLNLPQDVKRWETISARLEVLSIPVTRVLGVDMRVPGALWTAKHAGWVPRDFRFERSQQAANDPRNAMGSILGTLGCASAHFKVQTRAIIDGSPLAVVLEDDSWLEDDFVPRLWRLVTQELPCDWEATALLSRCPYGVCVSPHLLRVQPDGNEPAWRCHQGVNWGMHGVLYRIETLPALQEKWKAAVFDETRPHCMDVDVALASISDKVGFYAVPAVQKPGLLREMDEGSSRYSINMGAQR